MPSQLHPKAWDVFLGDDPDREYLMDGIVNGFSIVDTPVSDIPCYETCNYLSAENEKAKPKLDKLLKDEISSGKISKCNKKPRCIHAYGAVPKKNSDKLRPITDCSRPFGHSLNDHISYGKMRYKTVDFASKFIKKGVFFASVDIRAAYRSVCIRPEHRCLQGLKWQFGKLDKSKYEYYVDNFLCFGCSSSPGIFQRLSGAVTRMMKRMGYTCVYVEYLDDFLIIGDTYEQCRIGQHALIKLLIRLGFYISWDKLVSPCQNITFLGLNLDSITMSISLPNDKIVKLQDTLRQFVSLKRVKKRDLQSLAGSLAFASTVIKAGRTFSRRVIDLVNSVKYGHYFIRLNDCFRLDCQFWLSFMNNPLFNGTAKILDNDPIDISILQTDSSFYGYGVFYNGEWLAGAWDEDPPHVPSGIDLKNNWEPFKCPDAIRSNINILELIPVLIAARRFGHLWQNKRVFVYTDNSSVLSYINRATCKTSKHAMTYLRELFMISALFNFHLTARHLKGERNTIADCLSRLNDPIKWNELMTYVLSNGIPFLLQTR